MSEFSAFTFSLRQGDASLTLRSDSIAGLEGLADQAEKSPTFASFFGPPPAEEERGGAGAPVQPGGPPPAPIPAGAESNPNAVQKMVDEAAARRAEAHLAPGEERASNLLIKAAAGKSGKTVEELDGISKNRALALINGEE